MTNGENKAISYLAMLVCSGLVAVVLVACDATGDEVATLEGTAGPSVDSRQVQAAEAMVNCLAGLGVPVVLNSWPDGQAEVDFETGEAWILCQEQDGMCHGGGGLGQSQAQVEAGQLAMDRLAAKYQEEYASLAPGKRGVSYLITESADYTEPYRSCSATIDYLPPAYPVDPAEELALKRAAAEAGDAWAACARSNGHPSVADVAAPKADNYGTWAKVLLPVTMTPSELELLFEACPIERYGTQQWPDIGLDLPGYDGREPLRQARALDGDEQAKADALAQVIARHQPLGPPGQDDGASAAAP